MKTSKGWKLGNGQTYKHPTLAEQARERAAVIAILGWAKEDGTAEGRYCATTGELIQTAREQGRL